VLPEFRTCCCWPENSPAVLVNAVGATRNALEPAAGERDADIAEAMSISIRTVRSYLDRIRDKTGRRRRPELTRLAIQEGLGVKPGE
jgi:hypothetical protein